MVMTYHCGCERANRVNLIQDVIGMGQVIKEIYYRGVYNQITDTGVVLIVDDSKTKIITMYLATHRDLNKFFPASKGVPMYLIRKIDRNASLYVKNGKTLG